MSVTAPMAWTTTRPLPSPNGNTQSPSTKETQPGVCGDAIVDRMSATPFFIFTLLTPVARQSRTHPYQHATERRNLSSQAAHQRQRACQCVDALPDDAKVVEPGREWAVAALIAAKVPESIARLSVELAVQVSRASSPLVTPSSCDRIRRLRLPLVRREARLFLRLSRHDQKHQLPSQASRHTHGQVLALHA